MFIHFIKAEYFAFLNTTDVDSRKEGCVITQSSLLQSRFTIAHREVNPLPSLMVSVYTQVKVLELRGELTTGRDSMQ